MSDFKESVRAATTNEIDLGSLPATIDGVTMNYNDRFLVKDQGEPTFNGIWRWRGEGSEAVRASDGRGKLLTSGAMIVVEEGDDNDNKTFVLVTDNPITIGSTELFFEELASQVEDIYVTGNLEVDGSTEIEDLDAAGDVVRFHGTGMPGTQSAYVSQVATTPATDTSPFGYTETQANDIITLLNAIQECLINHGLMAD